MYIKRYTIAVFVLIVALSIYVYGFITQDSMDINFFGTKLPSLPIALWVVAPVVLLYVGSVAHMLFYSIANALRERRYKKDHEKIVDAIADAYLGKDNRTHVYKTERYKLLGNLVDSSTLLPAETINETVENKKINTIIGLINNIKDGEVVDLRKYSLAPSNKFLIQNEKNRYAKGDISSDAILSNPTKYDLSLRQWVFVDYARNASWANIVKNRELLTKDSLFVILLRVNADKSTLIVANEELISLFKNVDLNAKDYIEISKKLSKTMIPDQRIKLFEMLANDNDAAMEAYIFTLFDFEMLSQAKEILDNSQSNEFMQLKAYSALRECGKHFSIDLFL